MRDLSTAITLGRTLLMPKPGILDDQQGSGCAIGMARKAAGINTVRYEEGYGDFVTRFPISLESVDPCCGHEVGGKLLNCITHLFDCHVFGLGNWTLDQLIDWVRSVEDKFEKVSPITVEVGDSNVLEEEVFA